MATMSSSNFTGNPNKSLCQNTLEVLSNHIIPRKHVNEFFTEHGANFHLPSISAF